MPHLYDNRELTFNDVKSIFTQASKGKLIGTEKSDGFAIYLGFVDGSPRSARNASDIKNGGMDYEALLARDFKGGPEIRDVYIKAFESYEKATRSLTDDEISKIFGKQGELFYLADLISVKKGNVVNYSKNIITIHHTGYSKYNSDTGEIEKISSPENAKYLDQVIDKFEASLTDDDFKIERTALLQLGDLSDGKDRDIALAKMQKAGFSGGMTIDQYLENQIRPLVGAQLANFPEETQQGILDRILGRSGANLTQISKGMPREQKKYLSDYVKTNVKQFLDDAIFPIEEAVHEFAVEALKGLHSAYILDNENATEKLKNQVEEAIRQVQAYRGEGWERAHDILGKQLQKLKHHDKITTAVEGFVFQYGDQTYKFTGNFAPVNQILGLFRYGRGKTVPPISAELQEQESENEIARQRIVALIPGAYKPPHRGHFEMVKHYSSEVGPNGVVYVIISPLSRGATGEEAEIDFKASYKIWQLYIQSSGLGNVAIYDKPSESNSPVGMAFEFLQNPEHAKPGDHIILGCSDKLDKRGVSDCQRFQNAEYVQKYAAPGVKILDFYQHEYQTVPGEALSATDFRKALATGDESEISKYIPEEASDRIDSILNILGYQVMKEEKKTNMSLLFSLVEEALDEKVSKKRQRIDKKTRYYIKKGMNPAQAAAIANSMEERGELKKGGKHSVEETSSMATSSVGVHAGPLGPLPNKKKKKKNENEEIIECVVNYLLGKEKKTEARRPQMEIDRNEYIKELSLRESIRKIIKITYEKKEKKQQATLKEEQELRSVIRKLILTEASEISDEVPHKSTGINVLEDLLKRIITTLEDGYKALATDAEQRNSFRAHVLKGIQNALAPSKAILKIDEQETIGIDIAGEEGPDEEAFIDIEDVPEPDEREEFGIPGEEETGRNAAFDTMKKIEKNILDSFEMLANPEDRETFYDYLITNIKLYFDKFEDEMTSSLEEPTTPEYEEAEASAAEEAAPEDLEPEEEFEI